MNRLGVVFRILTSFLLTSACTSDLDRIRKIEPSQGTEFTQTLAKEYRDLALFEADIMKDWKNADYFAHRSLQASNGLIVLPEEPRNRHLPNEMYSELSNIHLRLIAALNAGARNEMPEIAARAQVSFDCWLEQQEKNIYLDHIASCHAQSISLLSSIERLP